MHGPAGFKTLVLAVLVSGIVPSMPVRADTVPALTLQTLSGHAFRLPQDLHARVTVLVIGFTQKSGSKGKLWTDRLDRAFASDPDLAVLSVPIFDGVPAFIRPIVIAMMRVGVSPAERDHFILSDHDEAEWRACVPYRGADDVYILATDVCGAVLLRARGDFEEGAYQSVETSIRRLLQE